MKKAILILLTVFLAVSCSQVVYDNLLPEDISADNVSFLVERVRAGNDDTLKLKFTPVAYVSTYGYQVDNNSVVDINQEYMGYEDGYITYQLPTSNYLDTGLIKLLSRADSGDAVIATAEYSFLTTSDVAPNVIVSSRYENYVELYVSANDPEIEYQVTVTDKTDSEIESIVLSSLKARNGIITVHGLSPDHEYTLTVAHKGAGDENYGSNTTALDVDKYEYSVVISLEVTDTAFTASEIPEGINSVSLRKISDNEEKYIDVINTNDVNNGTAVFNFSDMKSLESGIFYVYAEDTSGKYISNTVSTTTPIIVKGRTENYRSVDLYIDFADDVKEDESVTFSVIGLNGVTASIQDFKSNDGHDVLTISGIDSNTPYDTITFTANKAGAFAVSSAVENVTTKSFAGKYFKWEGDLKKYIMGNDKANTNFIIYVDNPKEESIYPYYVYFSQNDDSIEGEKKGYEASSYRLMPIIDTSIGEPITSEINKVISKTSMTENNENVMAQNYTYNINSSKWNSIAGSSMAEIKNWYVIENGENNIKNIKNDAVITNTMSNAAIQAEMTTSFYFDEVRNDDGSVSPFVKFYNYGEAAMLGLYLNGNASTEWQQFESVKPEKPEYTYYLSLVDFSEGDAE